MLSRFFNPRGAGRGKENSMVTDQNKKQKHQLLTTPSHQTTECGTRRGPWSCWMAILETWHIHLFRYSMLRIMFSWIDWWNLQCERNLRVILCTASLCKLQLHRLVRDSDDYIPWVDWYQTQRNLSGLRVPGQHGYVGPLIATSPSKCWNSSPWLHNMW